MKACWADGRTVTTIAFVAVVPLLGDVANDPLIDKKQAVQALLSESPAPFLLACSQTH